jgi:hypothetical protein
MFRATLERRVTLDELFGPEIEAETEAVRREVDALIEAETKALIRDVESMEGAPHDPGLFYDSMYRYRELLQLKAERHKFYRDRFWRTSHRGGARERLVMREDDRIELAPCEFDGGRGPFISVYLFPSLRNRLLPIRLSLRDSIHQGEEVVRQALDALRRMIERLATLARIALDRCLSAIDDALTTLRRRAPVAAGAASSAPTPRELIGELLSPHVLAAGGGFGLFVIRC